VRVYLSILIVLAACSSADKHRSYPPGSGRVAGPQCTGTREPGTARAETNGGNCKADADCTAGKNGRCMSVGPRVLQNTCTYDDCMKDADCTGGPCECNTSMGNRCLQGNCKVDGDCGSGGACGRSNNMSCGGGDASYYCRSPKDDCVTDEDCKKQQQCVYATDVGHWTCASWPQCPVG
jgi:hypothetical protein